MAKFLLGDDGTLDTVLICKECGEELRYIYALWGEENDPNDTRTDQQRYDEFVEWALKDAETVHECEPEEEDN